MDIETKFNQGEEVFMPKQNEVLTRKIQKIHVIVASTGNADEINTVVYYDMYGQHEGNELKNVNESNLFKTKKAAARQVIKNMGYYVSEEDMKDMESQDGN